MVVQQKFRKSPEFVVTYDYIDIADGTGITPFYGFVSEDDSGKDQNLTTKTSVNSTDIETAANTTLTDFTLVKTLTFDLSPFNRPKVVKGTAHITFPFAATGTGGGSYGCETYVIAKVIKVDSGGGETPLANSQTPTLSSITANDLATANLILTIPLTNFKREETLRLTIEIWAHRVGGGSKGIVGWIIGHDPANRVGDIFTANPTQMILNMPFRLSL